MFLSLLAALSTGARAADYTFTRIADNTGTLHTFDAPAINDAGQVTFLSETDIPGADFGQGIFVGEGGPLATITDTSGPFSFLGFPSIDGRGQVSYFAQSATARGIFAGVNGATTLVDVTGPVANFGGDALSSPSGPFTTFQAVIKDGTRFPQSQAILVSDGQTLTTVADTTGAFSGFDVSPTVNGSGQVAFQANRRDGSTGIFVGSGGSLSLIADTTGVFRNFAGEPSINDRGDVAFGANLDLGIPGMNGPGGPFGVGGIFVSSGGQIRTLVDSTGPFDLDIGFSQPTINASGQVAFAGGTDAGDLALFVGADPVADRVIGVGDVLDGSTLTGFQFFGQDFNNVGQLVFTASLADGRIGVFRADPVVIAAAPEPSPAALLLLLAVPAIGATILRKR